LKDGEPPRVGRHGLRPFLRHNLIGEYGRLRALSRHVQLENVEAVVIADDIGIVLLPTFVAAGPLGKGLR
jgi:hypothetical protein